MVTDKPTKKYNAVTIRFRSRAEISQLKRAAKALGQSLNTFVVRSTYAASEQVLNRQTASSEQQISQVSA